MFAKDSIHPVRARSGWGQPMRVLDTSDLRKRYRAFDLRLSLTIEEGETLALVGPNGSGKTTLLHCLLNIVRREGGTVRFFNQDLDQHETAIKQRMGVFLEEPCLFEDLQVHQMMTFCRRLYPGWDRDYAMKMIEPLEIDPRQRIKNLSKGMRMAVALALAFGHRPELLILDEPTSGLDPKMRRFFVQKVREARDSFGPAVLMTSHIMRDVEDLADRIAFLQSGRIKLIERQDHLRQWRKIEGYCHGRLNGFPAVIQWHPGRAGESTKFTVFTARSQETVIEELRGAGAEVTGVFVPALEDIYDWVIDVRP